MIITTFLSFLTIVLAGFGLFLDDAPTSRIDNEEEKRVGQVVKSPSAAPAGGDRTKEVEVAQEKTSCIVRHL